jgi:hypothetical protein
MFSGKADADMARFSVNTHAHIAAQITSASGSTHVVGSQAPSRATRLSYATFVTLVIVGFGLLDGLWNHTVKLVVFFLLGADRANMAGLPFPPVGSVFHEVTGPLSLVAAIFGRPTLP